MSDSNIYVTIGAGVNVSSVAGVDNFIGTSIVRAPSQNAVSSALAGKAANDLSNVTPETGRTALSAMARDFSDAVFDATGVNGAAEVALGNVAATNFGGKAFPVPTMPQQASLGYRFSRTIDLRADFGCVGDGVTENSLLINSALTQQNPATYPVRLLLGPGNFKISSNAINNITSPIEIWGEGMGATQISVSGQPHAFVFGGASTLCKFNGLRHMTINGTNLTSGNAAVVIDNTFGTVLDDVYIINPTIGVSIQQCNNVQIKYLRIDRPRTIGIYAFGDGSTRNGRPNGVFVIESQFIDIAGNYTSGGATDNAEGIVLDGFVQTISADAIRITNIGRGVRTSNSYGLAQHEAPSYLICRTLEVEQTWMENYRFESINHLLCQNFYGATCDDATGAYFGAGVFDVQVAMGQMQSTWLNGITVAGGQGISLRGMSVGHTGGAGPGVYAGILVNSGDNILVDGGRWGKTLTDGAYTENQAYAIKNVSGTNVRYTAATDMRLNGVSATNGTVTLATAPLT